MNDCEKYTGLMHALLDGEITSAEDASLRGHVAVCGRCAAELHNLRSLTGAFKSTPFVDVAAGFNGAVISRLKEAGLVRAAASQSKVVLRWLGVAAAVAGTIPLIGAVGFLGRPVFKYLLDAVVWLSKGVADLALDGKILLKTWANVQDNAGVLVNVFIGLFDGTIIDVLWVHSLLVVCVALTIGAYMLFFHRRAASQV